MSDAPPPLRRFFPCFLKAFMTTRQRTTLLTAAGLADLACFVIGGLGYGETWRMIGAIGLLVWLVLIELTRQR
jgi:hypothetical protein